MRFNTELTTSHPAQRCGSSCTCIYILVDVDRQTKLPAQYLCDKKAKIGYPACRRSWRSADSNRAVVMFLNDAFLSSHSRKVPLESGASESVLESSHQLTAQSSISAAKYLTFLFFPLSLLFPSLLLWKDIIVPRHNNKLRLPPFLENRRYHLRPHDVYFSKHLFMVRIET